jgi:rod shape-determining protein MreD
MKMQPAIVLSSIFILAMVETSFLNHFVIFNNQWLQIANLVALFVLVYSLLEQRKGRLSWFVAAWGGLLLDFYSNMYFGIWTMSFLILVFTIKKILRRYVSIPSFW